MSESRQPTVAASIEEWQAAAHQLSRSKGWWDDKTPEQIDAERRGAVIALLHRDLSESLEKIRRGASVADTMAINPAVVTAARALNDLTPEQIEMLVKLALIHSEVSEAVECVLAGDLDLREGDDGKPEGLVVELADAVIRVFDFCGRYALGLAVGIWRKHAFNAKRAHRHGGKLA